MSMELDRPQIMIPLSKTDRFIEAVGIFALLAFWILLAYHYAALPEKVPMHYNASGVVDRYGSKVGLFVLPAIATLIFILFGHISKSPHTFNFPVAIHADNARPQYTMAIRMLRYLKLSIIAAFFLVFVHTLQVVDGHNELLGKYLLPLTLLIILAPIFYFFIQSSRCK